MAALSFPVKLNGHEEVLRFHRFPLINKRKEYVLNQVLGLNQLGKIDQQFVEPEQGSILAALIEFIRTGSADHLIEKKLEIIENPGKDLISRNVTLLDTERLEIYVVGGIGLVRFDPTTQQLTLENPDLEDTFHAHQKRHKLNVGGTNYISNNGRKSIDNDTPLGVSALELGQYNLLDKIQKTLKVQADGISAPDYIAAGQIKNLGNGEWGFSIYKTAVSPDYLLNLKLYIDSSVNLKPVYFDYLERKYQTLRLLHQKTKHTHGQPTIGNACATVNYHQSEWSVSCILKDMATMSPLPTSTEKTLVEGPCPQRIGINIKKSPLVAAITYDLQVAITQELNLLLIASEPLPNANVKLQFLHYQFPKLLGAIIKGYGINTPEQAPQIIGFCMNHFMNALKLGNQFNQFNEILGGLSANAILGLSNEYQHQIEVIPDA